jgi:hypothetical protein
MHIWRAPQRRKGERGNGESLSAILAGKYTTTFLMMVTISLPVLLFSNKIFSQGNKFFCLVIIYLAPFYIVNEALYLIQTETSSLGSFKIVPRNLKKIVRSWIRLLVYVYVYFDTNINYMHKFINPL